jgi:AraC-like DNA-binding protein
MQSIYGNEKKEDLRHFLPQEILASYSFILNGIHFSVRNVSLWHVRTPWQVPVRKINDCLIWLVMEGNFTARVRDEKYELDAGRGVIVPEYVAHSFDFAGDCNEGKVFVIHADIFPYSGRGFPVYVKKYLFCLAQPELYFTRLKTAVSLRQVQRQTACLYARNPVQDLLLECAANDMFSTESVQNTDTRIQTAIEFFRDNFMHDIGVADAAQKAGLGEVQFRTLFHKYSGISPSVYLKHLRLRQAAELLAGTTLAIKDVAGQTGFNSVSYFCFVFRKDYGISPEVYRQNSLSL